MHRTNSYPLKKSSGGILNTSSRKHRASKRQRKSCRSIAQRSGARGRNTGFRFFLCDYRFQPVLAILSIWASYTPATFLRKFVFPDITFFLLARITGMPDTLNILFIGDIVGLNGLAMVTKILKSLIDKHDAEAVIVNGENIYDGKALS